MEPASGMHPPVPSSPIARGSLVITMLCLSEQDISRYSGQPHDSFVRRRECSTLRQASHLIGNRKSTRVSIPIL